MRIPAVFSGVSSSIALGAGLGVARDCCRSRLVLQFGDKVLNLRVRPLRPLITIAAGGDQIPVFVQEVRPKAVLDDTSCEWDVVGGRRCRLSAESANRGKVPLPPLIKITDRDTKFLEDGQLCLRNERASAYFPDHTQPLTRRRSG